MIWSKLNFKKRSLSKINLINIKNKMIEDRFDPAVIGELLEIFEERINRNGESAFQKWLYELNFSVPEEYQNSEQAIHLYNKASNWLEKEVINLERETRLTWEIQGEDLQEPNEHVRKTQLVIRHRLTEVILDILDKK